MVNGIADAFDFGLVVRPAKIVDFDKVLLPLGEERENRIVVRLRTGFGHIDTEHVTVPFAGACLISDIRGMIGGAFDRRILFHCLARDASQKMYTKLQAFAVEIGGESLEAD